MATLTNTYTVFHNGVEYTCSYFFDTERGDGVEIKNSETGKWIGELYGYSIPEVDVDEETTQNFEEAVQNFIDDNE